MEIVSNVVSVLSPCCDCNEELLRLSTRAWHDGLDAGPALRRQRQVAVYLSQAQLQRKTLLFLVLLLKRNVPDFG